MSVKIKPNIDDKFIGVPFVKDGRSHEGTDCLGLVYLWYAHHGVVYEEAHDTGSEAAGFWWAQNPRRYIEGMKQYGHTVAFFELKRHDMILFFDPQINSAMPIDAGIMVDDRHFLWTKVGAASEVQMLNEFFRNRFWGGLRLFKVTEARIQ